MGLAGDLGIPRIRGAHMAGADTPMAASGVPIAPAASAVNPANAVNPAAPGPQWVGTPRARRRAGLSIYSILLIMLLSVSVL